MFPYEILLGLRGSMRTCTHRFIGRQNLLQKLNVEVQPFCNSAILTRNKYSLRLSYRDVNINSIRKFHTQLLVNLQTTSKDSKPVETDEMPKQNEDPFDIMVDSVSNSYKKNNTQNSSQPITKWLTTDTDKIPSRDIEKLFPEPKAYLYHLYNIVKSETNNPNCLTSTVKNMNQVRGKQLWLHTYKITWPENMSFTALAHSKPAASRSASLKVLYWLKLNDRIRNRQPVIYEKKELLSVINAPVEITFDKNVLNEVDEFLNKYEESILGLMENGEETSKNFEQAELISGFYHPISPYKVFVSSRNKLLQRRYENLKNISKPDLPIFSFKNQILKELEKNQALVIKGDTGCGKTTQVPQFIMDHFAESGLGAECAMIVTQPRRISAISLAERIAFERQEEVGDVVGYQVRLNQRLPKQDGAILFCTTGILIKKMQGNPSLQHCSHVIVDEAHERSIQTDMLLVLLKRAMVENPKLKIIIMSATINADLFQEFLNCNSVEVPGRLFPVEMNFLEDIDKLGVTVGPKNPEIPNDEFDGPLVNHDHITNLINWICHNKPPGAILCFLPGWNDILRVQNNLEYLGNRNQLVIPLHSKLPHATQHQIFSPAPEDKRKIILATDIAETGITVPDVVYVIDSACHKEVRWHENRGLSSISTHWLSQANINQRKGRAGRVQKGESYHFITRDKYETLDEYPVPEVHRVSLEKTVLLAKIYSNEKAGEFFSSMPQPPRSSAIEAAVFDLQVLGALTKDEDLTPLGKRIAFFTIHPKLSKALVYGSIFQCLNPVSTAVTNLSLDTEIFLGVLNDKARIRKVKSKFHPSSDHLAISWVFSQWYDYLQQSPTAAYNYCKKNRLVVDKVKVLHKSRDMHLESLRDTGVIKDLEGALSMHNEENEYALFDEMVRGVLLAGFDQVLKHRDFEIRKGRFSKSGTSMVTEDDSRAQLATESVNYKRKSWPSPYLIYYQKTHLEERRTTLIRESSMVSPLTVLLFSQGQISGTSMEDPKTGEEKVSLKIVGKDNIDLFCDARAAESLLRLRDTLWTVVRFYVENNVNSQSLYNDSSNSNTINLYRAKLLKILAKLLASSSKSIDAITDSDSDSDSLSSLYYEDDGSYR